MKTTTMERKTTEEKKNCLVIKIKTKKEKMIKISMTGMKINKKTPRIITWRFTKNLKLKLSNNTMKLGRNGRILISPHPIALCSKIL